MCRNIKQLRQPGQTPTNEEIEAAALQYVRKTSGYRFPSKANQAVLNEAISQVAAATRDLLDNLSSR